MPKTDIANPTREALLAAAREEFAEHGIAGARVDRIAQRAGVNKERIYGHFGNKEKLFDAVMKVVMDELAEVTSQPGDDPAEYVGELFDHYLEHPDLLRLLMWEGLYDRTEGIKGQQWRIDRCRRKVESLAARLGREPSPEVGRMVLSLMGLAMMPMALPQLAELLLGEEAAHSPAAMARMREHITAFARAAVENMPPAPHDQESAAARRGERALTTPTTPTTNGAP